MRAKDRQIGRHQNLQLIKTSAIRANIVPLASVIDKEAAGAGNPGVIAVVLALELGIREAGLDRRGDTKGLSTYYR